MKRKAVDLLLRKADMRDTRSARLSNICINVCWMKKSYGKHTKNYAKERPRETRLFILMRIWMRKSGRCTI